VQKLKGLPLDECGQKPIKRGGCPELLILKGLKGFAVTVGLASGSAREYQGLV
jgi:hypothetical protein